MADVTFKYLNGKDGPSARSSYMQMKGCAPMGDAARFIDYEAFLNMEDFDVLAAAQDIERGREEISEPQIQEPRDIKRIKRLHHP